MVLDRVVVVDDFYCNWEEVADNAKNQLGSAHAKTTGGGNMNVGSMQDAFQRYISHKITGFPEFVDSHDNGCFTNELDTLLEIQSSMADWTGLIYLGHCASCASDDDQGVLLINVPNHGEIQMTPNTLVLFRSRHQSAASLVEAGKTPIFQVFFFNTHNSHFLAPDHHVVRDRLHQHKILPGVLSLEKCHQYIQAAEKWATDENDGSWTRNRHDQYPTTDIPISMLDFNDELVATVKSRVFPAIAEHYLFPVDALSLYDFFIIKYDANAQSKLDWHRDVSLISFNFALNSDFVGGGTSFPHLDEPVRIGTGDVVMHTGKLLHSGNNITEGLRYIIVGFVQVDSDRVDYDFVKRTSRSGISDEDLFRNLLLY